MIVESYYVIRAALIIWPKYFQALHKDASAHADDDEENGVSISEELIQTGLALIVIIGIAWSYITKHTSYKQSAIKLFLFLQSI
jgi:hypothetical protein